MGNEVIYAAGGIVWKKVKGEYMIALVYRQRYGGKWSLPKGKLHENESWKSAAIREVEEEIGSKVRILEYAGTIHYSADGIPKVVIFWHMLELGRTSKSIDSEIDDIGWFSPKEAIEKIEYKEEKGILSGIEFPKSKIRAKIRNFWRFLNPITYIRNYFKKATRFKRLEGNLKTYREELEYWIEKREKKNGIPPWAIQARKLLSRSETELLSANIDVAWKNFNGAKRMHLFGLPKEELPEIAKVLRIEAEKLNEWRRKATHKLIGDTENPREDKDITADLLYTTTLLRDEHYNNGYYKNQLIRDVYRFLLIAMISITILILLYFWQFDIAGLIYPNIPQGIQQQTLAPLIIGIILFGMLGGCISSIFHIRDSSKFTRIPEIVNNNYVTSIRVLIGGALSLIIFVFLQSQFVDQIFEVDLKPEDSFTYFAISFVAGFTERLLLRAITAVAGKEA